MCFLAREPWIKLPIYTLAQTLGAFLGAGIIFGLYYGKHSPFSLQALSLVKYLLAPSPLMTTRTCPGPGLMTHSRTLRPRLGAVGERNKLGNNRTSSPPPHPTPPPVLTHDPWQGGEGSSERKGSALTHNGSNLSPDAILAFANNQLIVSGPNGTAGIFATYPSGHLDMVNGFFDQVWTGGT